MDLLGQGLQLISETIDEDCALILNGVQGYPYRFCMWGGEIKKQKMCIKVGRNSYLSFIWKSRGKIYIICEKSYIKGGEIA